MPVLALFRLQLVLRLRDLCLTNQLSWSILLGFHIKALSYCRLTEHYDLVSKYRYEDWAVEFIHHWGLTKILRTHPRVFKNSVEVSKESKEEKSKFFKSSCSKNTKLINLAMRASKLLQISILKNSSSPKTWISQITKKKNHSKIWKQKGILYQLWIST